MSDPFPQGKCLQCGDQIILGRKFCSCDCKSKSQIKRIILKCSGCGKNFSLLPYLKRKSNYCSMKCYWDSTRVKENRFCKVCGSQFTALGGQIKKGYGIYCSRKCQHSEYPDRVEKFCKHCNKKMLIWPSKISLVKFCSKKCKDDFERDYVTSICKNCEKRFELPRSDLDRGRGTFCSWKCFKEYQGPSSLELKMEKVLNLFEIQYLREVRFERFRVDFLLKDKNIVIECDGEHWHMKPINIDRDRRKEELLKSLGYKVLRFSGREINKYSEQKLGEIVLNKI